MKWKDWVHMAKLSPDKQLKPGDIDAIAVSGIMAHVIQDLQKAIQKKRDNAVIQI
jgi:heptaprenylglyceryl phosphate synthase